MLMKKYIMAFAAGLSLSALVSCSDDSKGDPDFSAVGSAESFTDPRDGKTYRCVKIGNQIWMAENLAYFNDGGQNDGCYTWNQNDPYDFSDVELPDSAFRAVYMETVNDPETQFDVKRNKQYFENYFTKWFDSSYYNSDQIAFMNYFKGFTECKPFLDMFAVKKAECLKKDRKVYRTVCKALTDEADAKVGHYAAEHGYLYSLAGARMAVPDGWRLPTDEDWKKLEMALGMDAADCDRMNAWRGTAQGLVLCSQEEGSFNAVMSGTDAWTGGKGHLWIYKDECCYWWTNEEMTEHLTAEGEGSGSEGSEGSEGDVQLGVIRQVAIFSPQVWRGTTRLTNAARDVKYSVRLVRDL